MEVLYGLHPVEEAVRSGSRRLDSVMLARERKDDRLERLAEACRAAGVRVSLESKDQLTRLARTDAHQGALAIVRERAFLGIEDLLSSKGRPDDASQHRFFLALDGVEDPHNLGALLRTADGAGVDGVILPERRSAPVSATVAKTSAGASEHVRIARVTHLVRSLEQMKKANVRLIVVGSPGCVDTDTFRKNPQLAEMYNATLASERDIARQVAQEQGVAFADVFTPMLDAMKKAKAKLGPAYDVAGGDGVHPNQNGHLIMAYAFLKALGCDGNVGAFTLSLNDNQAQASAGHEIIWAGNGRLLVESSRYPFCFFGDPKSPASTAGIVEFFPFNQDLNKLTLSVRDAKAQQQYKVTWGESSKNFSGADLTHGINLAAEFVNNPFSEPFRKVEQQIRRQQNYETPLVKQSIHGLIDLSRAAPEQDKLTSGVRSVLVASDDPLRQKAALSVQPVRHLIVVEEAN